MSKIYISQFDHDRLMKLLKERKPHDEYDDALMYELDRAEIVDPARIPDDIVTMNSHVRFIDDLGFKWDYWLVYPEDADLARGRVSVLSPLGCALLGYGIGDRVTVFTPSKGRRDLLIDKVLRQPEREGQFYM